MIMRKKYNLASHLHRCGFWMKGVPLFAFIFMFGFVSQIHAQYTISGPNMGNLGLGRGDSLASAPLLISGSEANGSTVNNWSRSLTIPFFFTYFGIPVNNVVVSQNGLLVFDRPDLAFTPVDPVLNTPTTLPNANLPTSTVAWYWSQYQDQLPNPLFGPGAESFIITFTTGTAPNRRLHIWTLNQAGGPSGVFLHNQGVVLEESTNNIYVKDMGSYDASDPTGTNTALGGYVVGIQYGGVGINTTAGTGQTRLDFNTSTDPATAPNGDMHFEFTAPATAFDELAAVSVEWPAYDNASNFALTNETIGVTVQNPGILDVDFAVDNLTIDLDVTDPSGTTTNYSLTLTSGTLTALSDSTFAVATGVNMQDFGTYSAEAFLTYTDAIKANDTVQDGLSVRYGNVDTYPYDQDMESYVPNIGRPFGFEDAWLAEPEGANTGYRWVASAFNTPSANTGPLDDNTPSGLIYLHAEAGNPGFDTLQAAGDTAFLFTPAFDLTTNPNPFLEFYYHMFGANIGSLDLEIWDGASWTNLVTLTGQQQTASADAYIRELVDLNTYITDTVRFRFVAVRGAGIDGDIAIDDFRIFERTAGEVAGTNLSITAPFGCLSSEDVTFVYENNGLADIDLSPNPVRLQLIVENLTTGTSTTVLDSTLNTGTFVLNALDTVVVSGVAFDSAQYRVSGIASITGGTIQTDDTVSLNFSNDVISALPYSQDFESFPVTSNATSFVGTPWNASPSNTTQYRWQVNAGGTPSQVSNPPTGPLVDHTLGTATGRYAYTEASGNNLGDSAILTSPCIDLTTTTNPKLAFWYHMFGGGPTFINGMGDLNVDVLVNGSWVNVLTISGEQQSAQTDPWRADTANLAAALGTVTRVRFVGIRGLDYRGDLAIDDVEIFDTPPSTDLVLDDFFFANGTCFDTTETLTATLFNNGSTPINNFTVTASITGGYTATTSVTYSTGPLLPGQSVDLTFPTPVDFQQARPSINLNISHDLVDDNPANDQIDSTINSRIYGYPYNEDFDAVTAVPDGWTYAAVSPVAFPLEVTPGASQDPGTGNGLRITINGVNTIANTRSPRIIAANANTFASFNYRYVTPNPNPFVDTAAIPYTPASSDTMLVGAIFDCGFIIYLDTLAGSELNGSLDWEVVSFSLDNPTLIGEGIELFLEFNSISNPAADYWVEIDNFRFDDAAPNASITQINVPTGLFTCASFQSPQFVEVEVRNDGVEPLDQIDLAVELNGVFQFAETVLFPTPIPVNGSSPAFFSSTIDLSARGFYELEVYVDDPADFSETGDTAREVYQNGFTAPYENTFSSAAEVLGWEITSSNNTTTWELDTDQSKFTLAPDSGTGVLYFEKGAAPNGTSTLTSTCFEIPSSFTEAYFNLIHSINAPQDDSITVEITSGGTTITQVFSVGDSAVTALGWSTPRVIDLTSFIGATDVVVEITGHEAGGADFAIDYLSIGQDTVVSANPLFASNTSLELYPNPANDLISLDLSNLSGPAQITVTNANGQEVIKEDIQITNSNLIKDVEISALPEGVYIVRVISGDNVFTNKLVKE